MRKQNHANPPELQHNGRLNNSIVPGGKCKRPNALKHGVFSDAVLIPGEGSGQYKQLLAELMDEYKPTGPTLRDEVIELANLMWKRRRLRNFIQTKHIAGVFDPRSPAFNEAWGLVSFTYWLRTQPETCFEQNADTYWLGTQPETCFEQNAKKYLLPDKINYLQQKFPRSNYQSTSEWVQAVIKEIFSVLLPGVPGHPGPGPGEAADEMTDWFRQWKDDCQVAATIMKAGDLLEYDHKETVRLNASIVKQTHHCAALKAWEEAEKARSKT